MTAHFLDLALKKKSGGAKLVSWIHQTSPLSEMMRSCKCFPHIPQVSTFIYNRENSVIIKNAIILNIIHNILNLRVTEMVIYIISVLFKESRFPQPLSKY